MSDIPFQYNKREGRYTEFVGNPTGIIFVAAKRDQDFLLNQRSNACNMSSNLNTFMQLNVIENSSNLIQIAPENTSDMSHPTYHA